MKKQPSIAQQDYVKTPRPNARRGKKTNKRQPFPMVLVVAVALAILVFIGFLWFIGQQPAAPVVDASKETKKTAAALPEKPVKEPYTYINELETKQVQVEAQPLAAKAAATMICGTFSNMEGAAALKAKIGFAGLTAEIKPLNSKFRVVIGPYESRRQAQNDKNMLLRQKIANCWIPL